MTGRGNPGDCVFAFLLGAVFLAAVTCGFATAEQLDWQTIGACLVGVVVGVAYIYYGVRLLRNK